MGKVLESARHVAGLSRRVRVDEQAVGSLARQWADKEVAPPPWDRAHHFFDGTEKTVAYLLILDTLNFCFWPAAGTPKWEFKHAGIRFSGYHGLAVALREAIRAGVPLFSADYLARLTPDQLARMLGSPAGLQLLGERHRNLVELGEVLLRDFEGRPGRLVEAAGRSAVRLSGLLADRLASFRDTAVYAGREVWFLKRAQILAADLHGAFEGRGWGAFRDMGALTAFADYKLPQVMRQLGILRYSPELAARVDRLEVLEPGSPEEVEIRACTVWAVEGIRRALASRGKRLRAFEIDWLLWNLGQQEDYRKKPYHRTLTEFY